MRDVLEVLREKEFEIERVRKEIKAVRLAAVLLLIADDSSDQANAWESKLSMIHTSTGRRVKDRVSMFRSRCL